MVIHNQSAPLPAEDDGGRQQNHAWLLEYAANTHSQMGEDGIIAKILSLLPETDRWCVEFGAWDGIHLSNVRRLIEQEGYSAVLIEGDSQKFAALSRNYAGNDHVKTLEAFVGFNAEDGLDRILSAHRLPRNFDVLSIDIDGNDYHVWQSIQEFRPKVVCVEFNPAIPTEVHFVQARDPRVSQGCSLLALTQLARSKGYELVSVLSFNALFVEHAYFPRFGIANNQPQALRKDLSFITWFFPGYDGSIHLAGAQLLPWHQLRLEERRLQVLPRYLRSFPGNYSKFQQRLFSLLTKLKLV
jgi:hypothetical protein